MTIDFCINKGLALGLLYADQDSCEENGIHWGIALLIGPFTVLVENPIK